MKSKNFVFVAVALGCILSSSCNSVDDVENIESSEQISSCQEEHALSKAATFDNDVAMDEFLGRVDDLNEKYNHSENNVSVQRLNPTWCFWIMDGVTAAAGTIATGYNALFGLKCGATASELFALYITSLKLDGKDETKKPVIGSLLDPSLGNVSFDVNKTTIILADTTKQLTFVDSIGMLHNKLLDVISKNNKQYVNSVGKMDYDALYKDVDWAYMTMNIDLSNIGLPGGIHPQSLDLRPQADTLSYNAMRTFTKSLINSLSSSEPDFCASFEKARVGTVDKLNIPKSSFDDIRDFGLKIVDVLPHLDDAESKNYSKDLNTEIESSGLTDNQKTSFKIFNNIVANSRLYW